MADLITLSEYKTHEGISSSNEDAILNTIIPAVSTLIKTYCGISFVDHNTANGPKTEFFSIWHETDEILVAEVPIITVDSVHERDSQSEAYTELFSEGTNNKYEYTVNEDLGAIFRTTETGRKSFPKGDKSVKVVYKAGYDTLPDDIKLAIYDLIRYYKDDEYKLRRVTNQATLVNPGTTSKENDIGFPDHITRVLDLYKYNLFS